MNYALIGPPGAGKSTQAVKIIDHFGLALIDSGNLFREKLRQRVAVGLLARRYMAQGALVPDEVVDAMIEERLWHTNPERDILFDGFPRTVNQARFLERIFEEMNRTLDAVIYLAVDESEATQRLTSRHICRTCQTPYHPNAYPPETPDTCDRCGDTLYRRPDDIPEIVRVRQRAFRRVTGALLDYYQTTDRLIIIDGNQDIAAVTKAGIAAIETVRAGEFVPADIEAVEAIKQGWHIPPATEEEDATLNLVLLGGPGSGKAHRVNIFRRNTALLIFPRAICSVSICARKPNSGSWPAPILMRENLCRMMSLRRWSRGDCRS